MSDYTIGSLVRCREREWVVLPSDAEDDLLCVNAVPLLHRDPGAEAEWLRLLAALRDVKQAISRCWARPRLYAHGSKHLTAAFMFGRVFAPYELDIRQTSSAIWSTDVPHGSDNLLAKHELVYDLANGRLFVEIATRYKNIAEGTGTLVREGGPRPAVQLQLRPAHGALEVDNPMCLVLVDQIYREIELAVHNYGCTEIHLFAAAPQSLMMMLGRAFQGMPPVTLYEWTGDQYLQSCRIPSGVL